MKKFWGLSLFAFFLILISGRVYTYALGNICSGNWPAADPPPALDPICIQQCEQCTCAQGERCSIDCTNPPPNECSYICKPDPIGCPGACNSSTAGQCGLSGGCGGACEICQGPVYSCHEDKVGCESSPACYWILHPITSGSAPDFSYGGFIVTDLTQVLTPIAKIIYYAALLIGFVMIVIAGYTIMTSEGNPQKVQQGQEQLTAAILGILFVLLSAAILRVIINVIIGGSVSF